MTTLAGARALVSGGSGGIGGAIALALAAEGARPVLAGRDAARLAAAAERIREIAPSTEVETRALDLTDDSAVDEMARQLVAAGGVEVLVHSAGTFHAGRIDATPVEELDRQYRVNTRAPYVLTRALLPSLAERRGQIVFVSSSIVQGARATVGPYAASKLALTALADSLRWEVNRQGVRVLSVYPGRTASAMQEAVHRFEGKPYDPERLLQPADVAASVVQALLLPRTAEVTDLHIRPMQG